MFSLVKEVIEDISQARPALPEPTRAAIERLRAAMEAAEPQG
jgi:DNA-binding transcriptional ArsR family regulator